jgi:hypothetical protein
MFGQVSYCGLGSVVGSCEAHCRISPDRGDVDNRASPLRPHARQYCAHAQENSGLIDRNDLVPAVHVFFSQGEYRATDARVIHKHVDDTMSFDDLLDLPIPRCLTRNIHDRRMDSPMLEARLRLVQIGHVNLRALAGE